MALYPYNGYTVTELLTNASWHIESSISQKRDVDATFTVYIPSGFQRNVVNQSFVNGSLVVDGECFVL